jgi:hypothetical protein
MNVAGNQLVQTEAKESVLELQSLDETFSSNPMIVTTIHDIGEPFDPIPIDPATFTHLKNIKFTETYPLLEKRPFDLLIAEQYYSSSI